MRQVRTTEPSLTALPMFPEQTTTAFEGAAESARALAFPASKTPSASALGPRGLDRIELRSFGLSENKALPQFVT